MNPRLPLRESAVAKAIVDFLHFRGWRMLRQQSALFTNPRGGVYRTGEVGLPDFLAIYYLEAPQALIVWVETKSPQDRRKCPPWCRNRSIIAKKFCSTCGQARWKEEEERRGALVVRAASFEDFAQQYDAYFGWIHDPATAPKRGTQTVLPLPRP